MMAGNGEYTAGIELIDGIIRLANAFGADPEYARAGGGNASVKIDGILHIKPSGVPMATLAAADLVPLRIDVLLDALHSDEPAEGDPVRDAASKAVVGTPARRPSVEILFHALIPDTYVVHSHPPIVNAVTCNTDAEALTARLFGDEAVFVPYTDPGVPLAREIERCRAEHVERTGAPAPGVTLLGNHGLIVSGDSVDEVERRSRHVVATIAAALAEAKPDGGRRTRKAAEDAGMVAAVAPTLRGLLARGRGGRLPIVTSDTSDFVRAVTLAPSGRAVLTEGPLIPDQIVYAGAAPVVIDPRASGSGGVGGSEAGPGGFAQSDPDGSAQSAPSGSDDDLAAATVAAVAAYRQAHGHDPVVAVVPGVGAFAAGPDLSSARIALEMFTDALRVAHDADTLGRVRVMTPEEAGFIENWEAEAYRKQVAATGRPGRMDAKVVVVTGAAQGFGLGIATELVGLGAHVVLADLNIAEAAQQAQALCAAHGAGRAIAVEVNVADERSQLDAVAQVVATFGGVDVFISNAGVLRAGSVLTQPTADFDLVTSVNYRGYFLGVRAVAPVMAAQHAAAPDAWFDIVEINSKSGLEGSKRNFAYSGSKFGGIGLTQSFALELVECGIKVNAICPGNFLDGPLWTDPDRGLFVQYLREGKVPGAASVEDVRRFYEAKVPMGRGCRPADLVRAVCYVVEQQYETGQAVPVTGGQNMLN